MNQPQQANNSALDETGKTVFHDFYTAPDPRLYCEAMQALDYSIPTYAQPYFIEMFKVARKQSQQQKLKVLDLGSSYGINSALLRYELPLEDFYCRYSSSQAKNLDFKATLNCDKHYFTRLPACDIDIVGFDMSAPALHYGKECSLLQETVQANLEQDELSFQDSQKLHQLDCIISTGCIGYITSITLDKILSIDPGHRPFMVHCVLRMFSLEALKNTLRTHGYRVEVVQEPIRQRRLASEEETTQVLKRLQEIGIDPSGYEDQGWLYAWVVKAIPE